MNLKKMFLVLLVVFIAVSVFAQNKPTAQEAKLDGYNTGYNLGRQTIPSRFSQDLTLSGAWVDGYYEGKRDRENHDRGYSLYLDVENNQFLQPNYNRSSGGADIIEERKIEGGIRLYF